MTAAHVTYFPAEKNKKIINKNIFYFLNNTNALRRFSYALKHLRVVGASTFFHAPEFLR